MLLQKTGENYRWVHSMGLCQRTSPWLALDTYTPHHSTAKSDLTRWDRVRKLFAVKTSYDITESPSAFSPVNRNVQKQSQNTEFLGRKLFIHEPAPLIPTQPFSSPCSLRIRLQSKANIVQITHQPRFPLPPFHPM